MKSVARTLLLLFIFLTAQPLITWANVTETSAESSCVMSCCMHHAEKKAPKPIKGMCGEMSCNPFGQYSCCTGFIVSDNSPVTFTSKKLQEYPIHFNQSYVYHYAGNCWRPPENAACLLS